MKKKAFTLAELLAVIIILALLGSLIMPIINKTMNKGKQDAYRESVNGAIRAAQQATAVAGFPDLATYTLTDGVFSPVLKYDGKLDGNGTIVVNDAGKAKVKIQSSKYCAIKEYTDDYVTVTKGTCK